jgi:hypothetical protein
MGIAIAQPSVGNWMTINKFSTAPHVCPEGRQPLSPCTNFFRFSMGFHYSLGRGPLGIYIKLGLLVHLSFPPVSVLMMSRTIVWCQFPASLFNPPTSHQQVLFPTSADVLLLLPAFLHACYSSPNI